MNGQATRVERWGAFLLLATSISAFSWLRWETMTLAGRVSAREQQLEHLATLMAPRHRVDAATLGSLDGLFLGHRVVWRQTDAGSVLTLRPTAEDGRR